MQRWDRLNERQVTLLQRIADGDDLSDADGVPFRISARALQARRLVDVSRKGGAWRATVTDAGRSYLEHGMHPDDPASLVHEPAVSRGQTTVAPGPNARAGNDQPSKVPARRGGLKPILVQAQELVGRLTRGDGVVRVEEPSEHTRALYRRLIHAVKVHGLLADDQVLRYTGRSSGDIVMKLYDRAAPDDTDWNRIRLQAQHHVTVEDQIIAALRKDPSCLAVTEAVLPRALELVRVLASTARARGHRLVVNTKGTRPTLSLRIENAQRTVKISEVYDTVPHVPTNEERRRKKRNPWTVLPEHDRIPSGRLSMTVNRSGYGRTDTWEDDKRSTLESRIRKIMADIEAGFLEDQRQHAEQQRIHKEQLERWERQQAEELAQWEQAKAAAAVQAAEKIRLDRLRVAFDGWAAAEAIRTFCDGLEAAWISNGMDHQVNRWITWAREKADTLDPLTNPHILAEVNFDPVPKLSDLAPFMGEWSESGPHKAYRSKEAEDHHAAARAYVKNAWHHGMRGNPQAWRWRA